MTQPLLALRWTVKLWCASHNPDSYITQSQHLHSTLSYVSPIEYEFFRYPIDNIIIQLSVKRGKPTPSAALLPSRRTPLEKTKKRPLSEEPFARNNQGFPRPGGPPAGRGRPAFLKGRFKRPAAPPSRAAPGPRPA